MVCIHVLEHVPDDGRAMSELRRILRRGGWLLVMVPLDLRRTSTYEDATITDPAGREAAFWQSDHVRLYAGDIVDRLEHAGFTVEVWRPGEALDPSTVAQAGLLEHDWVLLCR